MRTGSIRRIVLSTGGTVSAVVMLLALKSNTGQDEVTAAAEPRVSASTTTTATPSLSPDSTPAPEPATTPTSTAPTTEPEPTTPPDSTTDEPADEPPPPAESTRPPDEEEPPPAPATRSVTGGSVSTKYGTVQVEITLSGDTITAATAVQCPSELPRSQEICAEEVPQLDEAAVAAQSADIDAVSGATYTSEGYIASLQSAIDNAGI
jgi:uncharacterized protein with FMN-binding domain